MQDMIDRAKKIVKWELWDKEERYGFFYVPVTYIVVAVIGSGVYCWITT